MNRPAKVVDVNLHPKVETILPSAELHSRKRRKHAVPTFKEPIVEAPKPGPKTKTVVVVHDDPGPSGLL